jgi:hypothetical protein
MIPAAVGDSTTGERGERWRTTIVLINLTTGLEDAERVTVAFLVATAALDAGKQVAL